MSFHGLHLHRPEPEALRGLLERSHDQPFSHGEPGLIAEDRVPKGFTKHVMRRSLGTGAIMFANAVACVESWNMHRGAGLVVAADDDVSIGVAVALCAPLLAPLPFGWIDATCRVISVERSTDRYAFVYGTLPHHPEMGEEAFELVHRRDDGVEMTITAISRPAFAAARALPAVNRALQRHAVNRYLDVVQAAASPWR
ncbi:MAG: DUF1990 family protein [Acidimicrobiia bacterium]